MFGDLFELNNFFELLDGWAEHGCDADLWNLSAEGCWIRGLVKALQMRVMEVERAHRVRPGASASHLILELDRELSCCKSAADLRARLVVVKDLINKAQIIALEDEADQLIPYAAKGERWEQEQRKKGFARWADDRHKHEQWRLWQNELPDVAKAKSKQHQARQLRKIHGISENIGTIAKRLVPLPASVSEKK